jgi:uracil-DNA glycosylase
MTARDSLPVHSSWGPVLAPHRSLIDSILATIEDQEITPGVDQIFSSLELDVAQVKCIIIGQDPYPTRGTAHGLAFSIPKEVQKIPASLANIFSELESDIGLERPTHGDLSSWMSEGVLLLNRVLTTRIGESDAHKGLGWQTVTEAIAKEASKRDAIAILWGRQAQGLRDLFPLRVESAHPSPLSAYRGFFGSKPFSQVNSMLRATNRSEINWSLK